jgi:hypothetical protein
MNVLLKGITLEHLEQQSTCIPEVLEESPHSNPLIFQHNIWTAGNKKNDICGSSHSDGLLSQDNFITTF